MKISILCLFLSAVGLCGCSPSVNATTSSKKALIVYFSWGGSTRTVANYIGEITGGDIFELLPVDPYTQDREQIEAQAKREVGDDYQPLLRAMPKNIEQYDVIYVGSPCWFATIAPPVATFLTKAELSGKTIVPFMTHGGSRMGRSINHIKRLAIDANVTEGLSISESRVEQSKADIASWLKKYDLIK